MLDTLSSLLNGGRIVLLSERSSVLAVLNLSNPATFAADGGTLTFTKIASETATPSGGKATSAQILGADGFEVFSCDVGDENSNAVIKLQTTEIVRNAVVQITSFVLGWP